MTRVTAAQQRLFDNAVLVAAIRLLFDRMRELYPCPILRDVVTIHNGQGLLADDRNEVGPYEVYAAGGLVGHHSVPLSTDPFVVIGRKGSAGKSTFAAKGGWVIDTAYYAQPNDSALDTKYLYYALLSLDFTDDIISTAIPGVNRTAIYRHSIPLPPIATQRAVASYLDAAGSHTHELPALPDAFQEQRRIVAWIEELAAKIEEARGLRREAKAKASSLIASSVSKLNIDERYWTSVQAAICDKKGSVRSGPFGSQLHHDEFVEAGVAAIGTRNVQVNRFDLNSGWYVTHDKFEQFRRYQVFPQDVLTTIVGASIGRFCVVPEDVPPAFTTKHIMALTLNRAVVEPKFVAYLLNYHPRCRSSIFSQCEGSAQPSLNASKVLATALAIPPLSEQRRILTQLEAVQVKVDALTQLQAETAAELDALLPSVLDKAFSGEL